MVRMGPLANARGPTEYEERCLVARNGYGCFSFLFDILLTLVTGGLWLIWIFVREMRRR